MIPPQPFGAWALERVRAGGYRPQAWAGLLVDSWARARATAAAQPRLTRSWRGLAVGLSVGALAGVLATARRRGLATATRLALPLALGTAAQAADSYAHLGLHRAGDDPTAPPHATIGLANWLTATRGLVATWLWSRLAVGAPLDDAELAVAIALIFATDLADGPVARRGGHTSPLGRYLDGEADLFAWLALLGTQTRRGQVPGWFPPLLALRWLAPVGTALARSFADAAPERPQPTGVGKAAGAGQVALVTVALAASLRARHPEGAALRRASALLARLTAVPLAVATATHLRRILGRNQRVRPN